MTDSIFHWATAPLGEIAVKLVDGSHNPPPKAKAGGPMLSARNIEDRGIVWMNYRFISENAFKSEDRRTQVTSGDVLLTIVGSIGRSTVVPDNAPPFTLQRSVACISVPEVLPRLLAYQFQSPKLQRFFLKNARGTAQKGIYLRTLAGCEVQIPPLAEQHRIVEAIESYISRLDDAVSTLERVQRNLRRYRAAVLKSMVEGRLVPTAADLAQEEGRDYESATELLEHIMTERRRRWEKVELARMIAKGKPPKNDKWKAKYREPSSPNTTNLPELPEGWCWASPGQVFSWSSGNFLPKKNQRAGNIPVYGGNGVNGYHNKALLADPTLVIGRVGAQCGNIRLTEGPSWITDNAIYAAYRPDVVNLAYWRVVMSQQNLNANAGGTGQPYVNQKHLNDLVVPVPPSEEQERIVAELENRLSVVDHVEVDVARNIARCSRVRQAVLKWAFEGRLADQDPYDEPAAALLERIRQMAKKPKNVRQSGGKTKSMKKKQNGGQKDLVVVLLEAGGALPPKELLVQAGYGPDSVGLFYEKLRAAVQSGAIRESRPVGRSVLLEVG